MIRAPSGAHCRARASEPVSPGLFVWGYFVGHLHWQESEAAPPTRFAGVQGLFENNTCTRYTTYERRSGLTRGEAEKTRPLGVPAPGSGFLSCPGLAALPRQEEQLTYARGSAVFSCLQKKRLQKVAAKTLNKKMCGSQKFFNVQPVVRATPPRPCRGKKEGRLTARVRRADSSNLQKR